MPPRKRKAIKPCFDPRYKNAAKYKIDYDAKRKSRFLNVRAAMLATQFSVGEANNRVYQQRVERLIVELDPRFGSAATAKMISDDGGFSVPLKRCMVMAGFKEAECSQANKQQRVRRLVAKTQKMLKKAVYFKYNFDDISINRAMYVAGFFTEEERNDGYKVNKVTRQVEYLKARDIAEDEYLKIKSLKPPTMVVAEDDDDDDDDLSTITMSSDIQTTICSEDDDDENESAISEAFRNAKPVYSDNFSVETMSTDALTMERSKRRRVLCFE